MKGTKVDWSELDYQDDNTGLTYGIELLDSEGFSIDCQWFGTYQERETYIFENKIQTT